MKKTIPYLIFFLLMSRWISAQDDTTRVTTYEGIPDSVESAGYITIVCDSIGMDIFIDDMLVGQTPIESPIPLSTGKHSITYFHPDYLMVLKMHKSEREVQELVSKGFQTVYVTPGTTILVNLMWEPYQKKMIGQKQSMLVKSGVGLVIVAIFLSLFVLSMK
ncbi:MAG: hypothetical protein H8E82_07230 [Candidatus Marinimicrobia bacterium]|nr:hypothetical protein [Candidatus Neomarinimicrobiota bacterium]MBL7047159.1 hypothetical protein [Candidatus Neomarinimicrobiota bacterium]